MTFAAAIAAAQKTARTVNPAAITYARGANTVPLTAGRGRSTFNIENGQGVLVTIESHDFLIETAALILAAALTLPERSDRITETVGATTYTYEVLELSGEPAWRYSDEFRLQLRVHTKLIG